MEEQEKQSVGSKVRSFLRQNRRVLRITKKPSNEEFKMTLKVSGLGILLIGFIGFVVYIVGALFT